MLLACCAFRQEDAKYAQEGGYVGGLSFQYLEVYQSWEHHSDFISVVFVCFLKKSIFNIIYKMYKHLFAYTYA